MKTLRPFTFLVLTALTILSPPDSVWAAPPEAFLSEADVNGQVSGNLSDSRAGLMTLQGLAGRNEITYGALPTGGFEMVLEDWYWLDEFYRANVFLPWNVNPGTDYFFSNFAVGVTDGGRGIGNLGMGYAYYLSDWDRLLRSSMWLDIDGEHEETYYQIGYHGESLGKYVDFRFDGAIVLNGKENIISQGLTGNTIFRGNNLLFEGFTVTETPLHHLQGEVGGPLAYLGDYGISLYGRAFYLFNTDNDEDTVGFGVRGEWAITEDITFNVNYTRDDIFDDSTWFSLVFTTPDGKPRHFARPIPTRERFSKPFVRTGRVPVTTDVTREDIVALSPKTGSPYFFAHVDPDATSGNGTFENPFGSINQLIAANTPGAGIDVIYVRPSRTGNQNDLQSANGIDLILQDNQFLLGSTIPHSIPVLNSPFGPRVTITPTDPGRPRPVLTNGNVVPGAVVYAADGNTIAGFTLDGDNLHDGIRGDGNSILDDLIDDGVIRMITVTDNQFVNTNIGINLPDLSDGLPMPGMPIWSSVSRNQFFNNNVAFDIGINTNNNDFTDVDTFDGTKLTMTMNNNVVTDNGEGGILRSSGPGAMLDLTARDLNGDGIIDGVFVGNLFDDNLGNGMSIIVATGGNVQADIGALPGFVQDINNPTFFNSFTNNGGNGLVISGTSSEDSPNFIDMRGNLFATNGLSGALIETGGDAVFVINGSQNVYMENALHGLEIISRNNSAIGNPFLYDEPDFAMLDADPTGIIFGNGDAADPLSVVFPSASVFDGEFFINNQTDGANILAENQSWQNIAFLRSSNRNTFVDNQNNGITIVNNAVATVDGMQPIESFYTVRGTEIGGSGADGIHIELLGAESSLFPEHAVSRYGPNVVTIGGQTVNDRTFVVRSGDQGVQIESNHTDLGIFNMMLTISGVGANFDNFGVYRPDRFYIDQFSAIQNTDDGMEVRVLSSSDVNFNMFRSSLIENGGVGLEADLNTANDLHSWVLDANGIPQPFDPFILPFAPPPNRTLGFAPQPRAIGSVFNIGSEIAGTGNLFQSNGLQGVFFQTLSPVTRGTLNPPNQFVVNGIISLDAAAPLPTQNVQGSLLSGEYASVENFWVYTTGRLNFYDNIVQTNGTPQNGADGLALSVGTSTNMIASIALNTFGGNTGADLNIVNVVSQDPEDSINNFLGNPNRDLLAIDPIGVLDLALGINFASPNPPTSGDLPTGSASNAGAQFTVNTRGITTSLAGRTELGIFTNADPVIKPANRNSYMVINAYGALFDINANTWTQSGSTVTTLNNAAFFLPTTTNTSGATGVDGNGTIRFGFNTVNFIDLLNPGQVFP